MEGHRLEALQQPTALAVSHHAQLAAVVLANLVHEAFASEEVVHSDHPGQPCASAARAGSGAHDDWSQQLGAMGLAGSKARRREQS